jgi:hypothetical protein
MRLFTLCAGDAVIAEETARYLSSEPEGRPGRRPWSAAISH